MWSGWTLFCRWIELLTCSKNTSFQIRGFSVNCMWLIFRLKSSLMINQNSVLHYWKRVWQILKTFQLFSFSEKFLKLSLFVLPMLCVANYLDAVFWGPAVLWYFHFCLNCKVSMMLWGSSMYIPCILLWETWSKICVDFSRCSVSSIVFFVLNRNAKRLLSSSVPLGS